MASTSTLLAFLTAALVFALTPGPAMLYAAARTLAGGRAAGFKAALGIALGGFVHVILAAAGLSILFHAVPPLYVAMKLIGAVYLIWLGIGMIRAKAGTDTALPTAPTSTGFAALRQSMLVEILNPKTAIFFVAFLPQFVDANAALPVWTQLTILGTVVVGLFGLGDLIAILFAGAVAKRISESPRMGQRLSQAGGVILIALGLRLAAERT
jgi:threonine/homoserine/homoserine lactone efflux protein